MRYSTVYKKISQHLVTDYSLLPVICHTIILLIITILNKISKSHWLSTVLISALIGQCNRTVHVMPK